MTRSDHLSETLDRRQYVKGIGALGAAGMAGLGFSAGFTVLGTVMGLIFGAIMGWSVGGGVMNSIRWDKIKQK